MWRGSAAAVVGDLDRPVPPPASETAIRVAPASIAFSTNSFNGWRSFHHFTGGDAVDQMLGQAAY